jgi:S-adenosylmethionine:tRNA ribosyltransferase-isomerase
MKTSEFSFDLPAVLIAQTPVSPRDACKLMLVERKSGTISHYFFYELDRLLLPGDVLVFNNSKVFPARIIFEHDGKTLELLLIRQTSPKTWLAIGKPGKKLQPGNEFSIAPDLKAKILKIMPDGRRLISFSLYGKRLEERLCELGKAPFPPYIFSPKATLEDYQTIYASKKGSIASPTAGLHFTEKLLDRLRNKGIQTEFVTLHVGLGTFLPVKSEEIEKHVMHSEYYEIDKETSARLTHARKSGKRIIAVGTTSVRVLESTYDPLQGFKYGFGETSIYIYPGYQWQCIDGIITNFHLPKSTLLLLVSSFTGKDLIMKSYQEAIARQYRFYSFGDAMLII